MAGLSFKVLVVDDEAHIVELARLYLSREGYEVEGVGDGTQAVARFGQLKPDLVILDIMLPGMDGLTICKEIRKHSQVPIIMLTARDEVTDKVVGLEVGADDYLTKPFHPQELVARAKALLRRARLEADTIEPIRAGKLEARREPAAQRCAHMGVGPGRGVAGRTGSARPLDHGRGRAGPSLPVRRRAGRYPAGWSGRLRPGRCPALHGTTEGKCGADAQR